MAIRRFSTSNLSGSKSSKLWDQETTPGTFESIATVIVPSAGAANISFTNIPQNYAHLQIRLIGRGTGGSGGNVQCFIYFNGITGTTNYSDHVLRGDGSSATAGGDISQSGLYIDRVPSSSDTANVFGALVIDILDYTSAVKNKTTKTLGGYDANGSGKITLSSGEWFASPTAVTSLTIGLDGSQTFVQNSQAALYGIRGA